MGNRFKLFTLGALCLGLVMPSAGHGRYDLPKGEKAKGLGLPQRVKVLTGENVHNVGELQMHVGNWGIFGSWPGSGRGTSRIPSARA